MSSSRCRAASASTFANAAASAPTSPPRGGRSTVPPSRWKARSPLRRRLPSAPARSRTTAYSSSRARSSSSVSPASSSASGASEGRRLRAFNRTSRDARARNADTSSAGSASIARTRARYSSARSPSRTVKMSSRFSSTSSSSRSSGPSKPATLTSGGRGPTGITAAPRGRPAPGGARPPCAAPRDDERSTRSRARTIHGAALRRRRAGRGRGTGRRSNRRAQGARGRAARWRRGARPRPGATAACPPASRCRAALPPGRAPRRPRARGGSRPSVPRGPRRPRDRWARIGPSGEDDRASRSERAAQQQARERLRRTEHDRVQDPAPGEEQEEQEDRPVLLVLPERILLPRWEQPIHDVRAIERRDGDQVEDPEHAVVVDDPGQDLGVRGAEQLGGAEPQRDRADRGDGEVRRGPRRRDERDAGWAPQPRLVERDGLPVAEPGEDQ